MAELDEFVPFEDFFEAVTGHRPYLWQVEAAERIGVDTSDVIDVGTGMGKTSIILAWCWAFARDQHRRQIDSSHRRSVPTRLHLVVDRRILVDSAADLADELATTLREASDGPVKVVADALRPLSGRDENGDPVLLSVRRLRGGQVVKAEHLRDPKIPAVITSTVDMLGSRLLWRGYGLSRGRRSIDAALVGADSLIVLDEAHLVPQFRQLLSDLDAQAQADETWFEDHVPGRQVVTMTATAPDTASAGSVLVADMDAETQASSFLAERVRRRDDVRIERGAGLGADALVEEIAQDAPGAGESVVVFVNTVKIARSIGSKLTKALAKHDVDVEVVIGGTPAPLRDATMVTLTPYLTGSSDREQARGLVVVATQTLEVGADLDFDRGFSEPASMSALVQRLGRVNRVGAREGGRFVLTDVVSKTDIYDDKGAVEQFWSQLCGQEGASLGELTAARQERVDLMPQVRPDSVIAFGRAEFTELIDPQNEVTAGAVSTWIRPAADDFSCQVVFRSHLGDVLAADEQYPGALRSYLDLVPVSSWERWSISVSSAKEVFGRKSPAMVRIDPAGEIHHDVDLSKPWSLVGSTLVVQAMSELASSWIAGFGTDLSSERYAGEPRRTLVVLGTDVDPMDESDLDEIAGRNDFEVDSYVVELIGDDLAVFTEKVDVTEQEVARRVALVDHNVQVGDRAGAWAELIDLPSEIVEAIREAGWRHDLGKHDPGFQYQLHLSATKVGRQLVVEHQDDGVVLAKSDLPRALSRTGYVMAVRDGGLCPGFRHEALSVVASREKGYSQIPQSQIDLIEYLIATHHGHFHGVPPAIETPNPDNVLQDATTAEWADWFDLSHRVRMTYGPYTVALAEAILRLADWECSALKDGL